MKKTLLTATAVICGAVAWAQPKLSADNIDEVLNNLLERDYIDSHREVSPLTQAPDAIVLDNSDMTMDDQMVWLMEIIAERFGK